MTEKFFTVKNKLGLHARPAALFVQTTNRFRSSVKVSKGDVEVDGKSIMGLMMLAAEEGSKLRIVANGEDEKDVVSALDALFTSLFNEKE
jgi:phosphocarrier protein HPr